MNRRLASLAFLFASSIATAQLTYFTQVRAWVDGTSHEITVLDNPGLQAASVSTSTGNSNAQAQIAPGINHAYVHWDSLDENNPAGLMIADAWTHWTDEVTISDPDLNGTLGTFTASLRVFGNASFALAGGYASGSIYQQAGIYGFWDSWIGTSTDGGGSFLVGGWFGDWYSDENGDVWYTGDELNQPLTEVTLEFIYGQPFLLRMNLEAYFDAENPDLVAGTVEGTLDFSHTAYWNGIGGFFDANGNPVDPSFRSGSGIDWRNPVPEPISMASLALGAGLLLRRKTKKS